mgnify:CR=1 FL=1
MDPGGAVRSVLMVAEGWGGERAREAATLMGAEGGERARAAGHAWVL